MTAAVARPPLFSHLVASRPDRDKGSLAATAMSIAIHGALIAATLVLTARVSTPRLTEPPAPVIIVANPVVAPPREARASGGGGGVISRSVTPPVIPVPPVSDIIPRFIPKPGTGLPDDPSTAMKWDPAVRSGPGPVAAPGAGPGNFVAYTKRPELINRSEVERILQRYYPLRLLQAGIGGTVVIWVQIDEAGKVLETRVSQPSDHADFDAAALRVGKAARFSPAYNRDIAVKVWVELPIVFGAK